jgi:hypothetical protein
MVYFQTQNPNLGKFWEAWEWKRLVISWPMGIFRAIFNGNLVPFGLFGTFSPDLVYCVKKNLATLLRSETCLVKFDQLARLRG